MRHYHKGEISVANRRPRPRSSSLRNRSEPKNRPNSEKEQK